MSRRSLRRGLGTLVLIAGALLPQTAWGQGSLLSPASRGTAPILDQWPGWSSFWGFLTGVFPSTQSKNRASIDPNGEPNESQPVPSPPASAASGTSGDNRASIDPDG